MLGSSDSEDAGNGYDDSRIRTLVEQAEGDSVTADRLVGDEQYYPDAMEFLAENEQPQHLILLTTSSPTMQKISDYPSGSDLRSNFKKIGEGVVLVCEQSVRYIVDDYTGTFSYATIDCVEYDDDVISLLVGSITYVFNVANAADEDETQTGVRALESRFLDAHR